MILKILIEKSCRYDIYAVFNQNSATDVVAASAPFMLFKDFFNKRASHNILFKPFAAFQIAMLRAARLEGLLLHITVINLMKESQRT